MPYVPIESIHNPATGTVAPATWGDQIHSNLEFLIDPPGCSVFDSGTQSIADLTQTAMLADSENFDNDAMHSTVTNTSRITCQTAGRYLLTANVSFVANATGRREVRFRVNGSTIINGILYTSHGTDIWRGSVCRTVVLNATDYVECMVHQNSGAALTAALVEFYAGFLTR
jgi:hypothetical protein